MVNWRVSIAGSTFTSVLTFCDACINFALFSRDGYASQTDGMLIATLERYRR